jgi:hypothetical protein
VITRGVAIFRPNGLVIANNAVLESFKGHASVAYRIVSTEGDVRCMRPLHLR